jgi:hypothetical protein
VKNGGRQRCVSEENGWLRTATEGLVALLDVEIDLVRDCWSFLSLYRREQCSQYNESERDQGA